MNISTRISAASTGDAALHSAAAPDDGNEAERDGDFASLLACTWFAPDALPVAAANGAAAAGVQPTGASDGNAHLNESLSRASNLSATAAAALTPDGQLAPQQQPQLSAGVLPLPRFMPDELPPAPPLNFSELLARGEGDVMYETPPIQSGTELLAFDEFAADKLTLSDADADGVTDEMWLSPSAINDLSPSGNEPYLPLQTGEIALLAARDTNPVSDSTALVRRVADALAQSDADGTKGNDPVDGLASGAATLQPHALNARLPQGNPDAAQAGSSIAQAIAQVAALADRMSPRSVRSLRIRLNPEELGRVDVQLSTDTSGRLHARLAADNNAAREILTHHLSHLRAMLERAGLSVDSLHVTSPDRAAQTQTGTREQQQQHADAHGVAAGSRLTRNPQSPAHGQTDATASRELSDRLLNLRA